MHFGNTKAESESKLGAQRRAARDAAPPDPAWSGREKNLDLLSFFYFSFSAPVTASRLQPRRGVSLSLPRFSAAMTRRRRKKRASARSSARPASHFRFPPPRSSRSREEAEAKKQNTLPSQIALFYLSLFRARSKVFFVSSLFVSTHLRSAFPTLFALLGTPRRP